ncbi:hypothetical protein B0T16DRAFT_450484 [Cercophora newfieldiana]|uniref:Uncharacterized protein n=1 Tax=Cercophora newfieldiana TaxID=92897 RepID=A0AA39XUM6_9PEZI|nr:hypothetical protein B0T16DRAFT_450484 [Cercophora newfieldiana]
MAHDLQDLTTPALLNTIVDIMIPFPSTTPLDFTAIATTIINGARHFPPGIKPQIWTILIALSKLGLPNTPPLTTFLPPPASPPFPRLALGLQLLLDQMPRRLFRGIDKRWCAAYFDPLAVRFAQELDSLPEEQKPWAWGRWEGKVTMDYYIPVRIWFGTPFVHCDTVASQERAVRYFDEVRTLVEGVTGTTDPYRQGREGRMQDVYVMFKVLEEGVPIPKEGLRMEGFVYWMCMLMDVHKPVVDRFGRYPTKNLYAGREDTEEEKKWMEEVGRGSIAVDLRERLRLDFEQGVWTDLGVDSDVNLD